MKKRLAIAAAVTLLLAASAFADKTTAPQSLTLPIGGNFTDARGGTGTFTGVFHLTNFAVQNSALVAQGYLTGTMTDSAGTVLGSVMQPVSLPAKVTSGSASSSTVRTSAVHTLATCPILHLDLGPLSLDLLGLQVNLSEVVLDISAQSGAGNLLGNLLCAVSNLLNGVGSLIDLSNLLNQILQALIGLLG